MPRRRYERENLAQKARELRHHPTPAEHTLWQALRGRALGAKFRRQVPMGRYIVDFACPSCRLVIEVDGGQHLESEYDRERDAWLREQGYTVLRYWNNQVMGELRAVIEDVQRVLDLPPTP